MQSESSPKSTNELAAAFNEDVSDQAIHQTGNRFSVRRLGSFATGKTNKRSFTIHFSHQ
jgi:hypothetical protein